MKIFSSFILLFFVFQTVLFGSGMYGVILENQALLCTCNHASEKEVHQSEEDKLFTKSALKGIKVTHAHEEKVKPSCHSAKKGEAHLCDCKKAGKKSDFMRSFVQNNYLKGDGQIIFHQAVILYTLPFSKAGEKTGYCHDLNRPPKQT